MALKPGRKGVPILGPRNKRYPSLTAAAEAEGITKQGMHSRIERGCTEWRYAPSDDKPQQRNRRT